MSGGSDKTTTVQSNEPYKAAKPLMDKGMGDALSLYNQGQLAPVNTSSTVVPYAQQTMQGMNSIQQNATDAMAPGGFSSQFKDIIGNGGYNQEQMDALSGIRSTATGAFDINSNPAYSGIRQRAMDEATNAAGAAAASMGRSGSGAHQYTAGRAAGDVAGDMDYGEYRNWQGRQDNALQQLFGMGQTGMDNLNPAYASMNAPAQDMMGVGSKLEDLAGRQLNDQLRITDAKLNRPANSIRELLGFAAGAGNLGSSTQTAQGPSNSLSNMLGYGLGGASLLGLL